MIRQALTCGILALALTACSEQNPPSVIASSGPAPSVMVKSPATPPPLLGATIQVQHNTRKAAVTVSDLVPATDLSTFDKPKGAPTAITITVQGVENAIDINPLRFIARNDAGDTLAQLMLSDNRLDSGPVPAGQKLRGRVGFDVPAGQRIAIIIMSEPLGAQLATWTVPANLPQAAPPHHPVASANPSASAAPAQRVLPPPGTPLTPAQSLYLREQLAARGCNTSSCVQTYFACWDGLLSGDDCKYYRANPIR